MRWTTALPETDDSLSLWRKVRQSGQTGNPCAGRLLPHQGSQGNAADALRGFAKELPAGDALLIEKEFAVHENYSRVRASSRFSSIRHTAVNAACSIGFSFSFLGVDPMETTSAAAAGSA